MKKILLSMILMIITLVTIGVSIAVATTTTGVVNSVTVNLREEPDTTSKILIQVGEETEVTILGESGDWYEVEYDGVTGYISKSCIDVESTSEISNSTLLTNNTTNSISNEVTNSVMNTTSNETTSDDVDDEENISTDTTEEADPEETSETIDDDTNTDEVEENLDLEEYSEITLSEDTDIRILPSMTSSKSNTIESGTTVTVLITLNNWVKITDGSLTGWVAKTKLN